MPARISSRFCNCDPVSSMRLLGQHAQVLEVQASSVLEKASLMVTT